MEVNDMSFLPKVLVVDDIPANLLAMQVTLEDLHAEIVCVKSGEEALELLMGRNGHRFCLLLIDVQMPDIDGYELAELIRNRADLKHIPIIFISASCKSALQIFRGYELGAVDFISKPYEPVILCSKVNVFLDIARYIQKIDTLTEARRQADYENNLKSAFLSNISHEIRTPLNAVIGFGNLLSFGQLSDKQREHVKNIQIAGKHLVGIVDNILDLAKIEARKMELSISEVNLSAILDELFLLIAESVRKKGLQAQFNIDHKIPLPLLADAQRLKQVLKNYLDNAIKFTKAGTISLNIELLSQSTADVLLLFSVTDTGIGISDEKIGKLFQNFQQADDSINRQYGGPGLGLVIAKQIVKLMGGEVGVDSVPGEGSIFWFSVKLERPAVEQNTKITRFSDGQAQAPGGLPA